MEKHIFLIGFMGAGKSAVARRLASLLSLKSEDTDRMIEEKEGKKIPEIFSDKGEEYFRQCETNLLRNLKDRSPMIISCGGGIAVRDENRKLMKEAGTVVLLEASPETILERVRHDNKRPLLKGHKNIKDISEMMDKRRAAYEAAADIRICTDGLDIGQVSHELLTILIPEMSGSISIE